MRSSNIMRQPCSTSRSRLHPIGTGILLLISISLGGCYLFDVKPGENIADEYGEYAGFCGFLQDCGTHGNGGGPRGPVTTDVSGSGGNTGTGASTGNTGN